MKHAAVCAPRRPYHEKNGHWRGENLAGEINVRDIEGHDFSFTGKKGGITAPAQVTIVKTILQGTVFSAALSTSDNSIIRIHRVEPFLQESLF
jgi:hypothetical protein